MSSYVIQISVLVIALAMVTAALNYEDIDHMSRLDLKRISQPQTEESRMHVIRMNSPYQLEDTIIMSTPASNTENLKYKLKTSEFRRQNLKESPKLRTTATLIPSPSYDISHTRFPSESPTNSKSISLNNSQNLARKQSVTYKSRTLQATNPIPMTTTLKSVPLETTNHLKMQTTQQRALSRRPIESQVSLAEETSFILPSQRKQLRFPDNFQRNYNTQKFMAPPIPVIYEYNQKRSPFVPKIRNIKQQKKSNNIINVARNGFAPVDIVNIEEQIDSHFENGYTDLPQFSFNNKSEPIVGSQYGSNNVNNSAEYNIMHNLHYKNPNVANNNKSESLIAVAYSRINHGGTKYTSVLVSPVRPAYFQEKKPAAELKNQTINNVVNITELSDEMPQEKEEEEEVDNQTEMQQTTLINDATTTTTTTTTTTPSVDNDFINETTQNSVEIHTDSVTESISHLISDINFSQENIFESADVDVELSPDTNTDSLLLNSYLSAESKLNSKEKLMYPLPITESVYIPTFDVDSTEEKYVNSTEILSNLSGEVQSNPPLSLLDSSSLEESVFNKTENEMDYVTETIHKVDQSMIRNISSEETLIDSNEYLLDPINESIPSMEINFDRTAPRITTSHSIIENSKKDTKYPKKDKKKFETKLNKHSENIQNQEPSETFIEKYTVTSEEIITDTSPIDEFVTINYSNQNITEE